VVVTRRGKPMARLTAAAPATQPIAAAVPPALTAPQLLAPRLAAPPLLVPPAGEAESA
jgi:hypothetical protein